MPGGLSVKSSSTDGDMYSDPSSEGYHKVWELASVRVGPVKGSAGKSDLLALRVRLEPRLRGWRLPTPARVTALAQPTFSSSSTSRQRVNARQPSTQNQSEVQRGIQYTHDHAISILTIHYLLVWPIPSHLPLVLSLPCISRS